MASGNGKGIVAIVTACMRADGLPDFARSEVEVSSEEYENGVHYDRAEARLSEAGYEEPFVHFDELEAPAFLHAAVQGYLATTELNTPMNQEAQACRV